jgi:hypothetical protein
MRKQRLHWTQTPEGRAKLALRSKDMRDKRAQASVTPPTSSLGTTIAGMEIELALSKLRDTMLDAATELHRIVRLMQHVPRGGENAQRGSQ